MDRLHWSQVLDAERYDGAEIEWVPLKEVEHAFGWQYCVNAEHCREIAALEKDKAKAWDEGFDQGMKEKFRIHELVPNPYIGKGKDPES